MVNKFVKNILVRGKIHLRTGLHIGGLKETVEIGGTDNPVMTTYKEYNGKIREIPYIPGSSLKGKIRALLELTYADDIAGKEKKNEKGYVQVGENYIKYESQKARLIPKLFGIPANTPGYEENVSRIIVRDAFPTEKTVEEWEKIPEVVRGAEIKAENAINRITSRANPRFFERIPADSEFEFEIILRVYENDDENAMLSMILEGMKMLEDNYLGGFGSRGYGKIEFRDISLIERSRKFYEGTEKEKIIKIGGSVNELIEEISSSS